MASQVKFRSDYMGINHFRNQTFFISETELSNLPTCENKKYFRRPPAIQSSSNCETELLVYSRLTCEIVDTASDEPTISQTESGIIFSFSQPESAVVTCPDFKQVRVISGLGVADLPVQCEIKINETVFKDTTAQPVSLVIQDAYMEIGNMSQFISKPIATKTPIVVKPKLTPQYILAASFQYHVEILLTIIIIAFLCNICLSIYACKRKGGKYSKVTTDQELTEVVSIENTNTRK